MTVFVRFCGSPFVKYRVFWRPAEPNGFFKKNVRLRLDACFDIGIMHERFGDEANV